MLTAALLKNRTNSGSARGLQAMDEGQMVPPRSAGCKSSRVLFASTLLLLYCWVVWPEVGEHPAHHMRALALCRI